MLFFIVFSVLRFRNSDLVYVIAEEVLWWTLGVLYFENPKNLITESLELLTKALS